MGIDITTTEFSPEGEAQFKQKLLDNLQALKQLMRRPGFGVGNEVSLNLGAELEMYIVDADGAPLPINQQILDAYGDPQLTLELNQYNLEYNLSPCRYQQQGFTKLEQEILKQLQGLDALAAGFGGRVIPIGILPTLQTSHFGPAYMCI